jgi:TPR repeat protein
LKLFKLLFLSLSLLTITIIANASSSCYDLYLAKNYDKALSVCGDRANEGDVDAQYNLGVMYDQGYGVLQDYNQAIYWYKKAAEQGLAKAQVNLGGSYFKGRGVIKDDVEAYVWWNVAAAQGKEVAGKYRDLIAKTMTPAQIAKAQELSKVYFQKYVKQ